MNVKTVFQTFWAGTKAHQPEIMVVAGLVTGAGALVMAAHDTPVCLEAFDKAEKVKRAEIGFTAENSDKKNKSVGLDWKTKGKIILVSYWKTMLLEMVACGLIIGGTKIRLDRYTGIATCLALKTADLEDLKKVIAAHPDNWKKKFDEKRAEMHLDESNPSDIPPEKLSNTEVPMPLPLFWDDQAKIFFRASDEDLRDYVAEITHQVYSDPFQQTSMNSWMRIIEHEDVANGDYYVLSLEDEKNGPLKYTQIGVKESPTGEPARMMKFTWDYHLDSRGMYDNV